MRNAYLIFLLFPFLLFSCKKDKPVVKTYKVTLNATGFTQQIISLSKNKSQAPGFSTDATANLGYIPKLLYYVYDLSGNYVHMIEQNANSSNIGTIEDYLPAGTYNVYMAAGGAGLAVQSENSGPAKVVLGYSNAAWQDTFYGYIQLTVSGNVNQSITLNRLVGELELQVLDAIPSTAATISLDVSSEDFENQPGASPSPISPAALHLPFTIPAASIGASNTTYVGFINNTIAPFNVVITCYDSANAVLATATVNNVTCQVNKKTILQGKLFGSNVGFNFTLNPMISTPINQPF